MPVGTPYYSDMEDSLSDQLLRSSRGRTNDSGFYSPDSIPLQNLSISSTKKRHGTLDASHSMEQDILLAPGPTKHTASWESQHTSSQEANFRCTTPRPDYYLTPPVDRLNLLFFVFILHGIGTLMPWNMFITAKSYFVDYKLNVNDTESSTEEYREHFLSYIGVASQVPNVICNALNIFFQFGAGSMTVRIIGSILIEIGIFIITVVLAMLDSSTWAGIFFYSTMASVVVLNMANGLYQNSLYGLAAKLPMKYSMAIVLGSNVSGTFASIISILSIALSPNQRTAAIYYFITALFVLLACVDTYFALPLIKYYRYYDKIMEKADTERRKTAEKPPYLKIFGKVWPQCLNVFLVFFVTLTIFPALHSDIKPIDKNFIIPEVYFTPVTCYLCFNFFAMLGSLVPNWIRFPGKRFLWIPVVLRILMIPYFMLCNYKPDKRMLPVLIDNDWAYIGMAIAMGFTSGYYSSLAMMYAPTCVSAEYAPIAGMMAAFFLVLGIVCGVNFTFFVSWLVESNIFNY